MNSKSFLFIGGKVDGKFFDVHVTFERIEIDVDDTKIVYVKKLYLTDKGERIYFFAVEGISKMELCNKTSSYYSDGLLKES